jgi:hypothetical protein
MAYSSAAGPAFEQSKAEHAAWRCRCCDWPDDHDPLDPTQTWPPTEGE